MAKTTPDGALLVDFSDGDTVTDPDAEVVSIIGLLRGILTELQAQTVILEAIATNTEV